MMNTIKNYAAYFTFDCVSIEKQAEIQEIFDTQGLESEVCDDCIEFSFEGRDLSDQIVHAFAKIALILNHAEGELRCEIDEEEQDPHFVFYTIARSKLWAQPGKIVRSEIKLQIII